MKYFNFLLSIIVVLMLFVSSCDDDSEETNLCSSSNQQGECENPDEYCNLGVCVKKVKECEPICTDGNICIEGECSASTKELDCKEIETLPDNAESVIVKVTVNYDEVKQEWETPSDCEWNCKINYEKSADGSSCIEKQEEDLCENIVCENGRCSEGVCICFLGFTLNSDGVTCEDINECDNNNGDCSGICINNNGGYNCACESGFILGFDAKSCNDIDECVNNTHNCDINAACNNIAGSFECTCKSGYEGDGLSCTVIQICENNPCTQEHKTVCKDDDNNGIAECFCDYGYKLNETTGNCEDIDECDVNHLLANCNSNASCHNTEGAYECICNAGYEGDGLTCTDIDECTTNSDACIAGEYCQNTSPDYNCIACNCVVANTVGGDDTCSDETGQCNCDYKHTGLTCNDCADGFILIDGQCES